MMKPIFEALRPECHQMFLGMLREAGILVELEPDSDPRCPCYLCSRGSATVRLEFGEKTEQISIYVPWFLCLLPFQRDLQSDVFAILAKSQVTDDNVS